MWLLRMKTALHRAVRQVKSTDSIKKLLDDGVNVNAVEAEQGKTALHIVASKKSKSELYDEVLKMLVDAGADVNIKDNMLRTALHYAVDNNNFNMVKILINNGSILNGKDIEENSVLMLALRKKTDYSVINYLLSFDIDVNEAHSFYGTPLHLVCASKHDVKIIKKLLEKGSDINAIDGAKGMTPLMSRLGSYRKTLCGSRTSTGSSDESKKMLRFLLDHSDVNILYSHGPVARNILQMCCSWKLDWQPRKIVLEHLAKMKALDLAVRPDIFDVISENSYLKSYFEQCTKELSRAKDTKLHSWITYFNLLVDVKRKLKNYAGNEYLIADFQKNDCVKMFPIYGFFMQENLEKGIKRRRLFDESCELLSDCLQIFNPTHLVVRDVLDCLRTKELTKFCSEVY